MNDEDKPINEISSDNVGWVQQTGLTGGDMAQPLSVDGLLADPFAVNSFLELIDFMRKNVAPQLRKFAFERMIAGEQFIREGDVFYMNGAEYDSTESQTAQKLVKAGYFVVFPGRGQIKAIKKAENDTSKRKNDCYLYDKKTYAQSKIDLKSSGEPSVESIAYHISSGSGQAPVIALDITGKISKKNLIKGIRSGWTNDTKRVLLNYKGQWYELNKKKAFDDWMEINLP
jgi:hypothetical protein